MPFTLSTNLGEESSGSIVIRFRDRDDQPVTPNGANWTLTDEDGTVINSRENVVISSPATQEEILLQGNDLTISSGFTGVAEKRIFTVQASYDSDLGSGIPLNEQATFYIDALVAVP
jgi:predicted NAD/FAD-dependent oxidoreductase